MLSFEQFKDIFDKNIKPIFDNQYKKHKTFKAMKAISMIMIITCIITFCLITSSMIYYIIHRRTLNNLNNIILYDAITVVFSFIFYMYYNISKKNLRWINKDFYSETLTSLFEYNNSSINFDSNISLCEDEYDKCLLFPDASSFEGNYLLQDKVKGLDISHIYSKLILVSTDSKGAKSKQNIDIFNGLFARASINFNYNGYIKICPKSYIAAKSSNKYINDFYKSIQKELTHYSVDDKYLDKTYSIDGLNSQSVSYIFSKGVLSYVDELYKKYKKPVMIAIKNSTIYIGIDNFNPLDISNIKNNDAESFYNYYCTIIETMEIPYTIKELLS